MPFSARQLAVDLLGAEHRPGGILTASFDIGGWSDETVREAVDYILANRDQIKLRLKGIRTDSAGFWKFAIPREDRNLGHYRGVPVVTDPPVPFDTMELTFEPQRD